MDPTEVSFEGLNPKSHSVGTRKKWIEREMKKLYYEYYEKTSVKSFCGTWNVAASNPPPNLHDWIPEKTTQECDLVVIGLQETVNLSNPIHATTDTFAFIQYQMWRDAIGDCLNKSGRSFRIVAEKGMLGLYLVVFVREPILSFIKDMRVGQVATGALGIVGNKGAVACSFILHDTSICIVNSHLASGREMAELRESEFRSIDTDMYFPVESTGPYGVLLSPWTTIQSSMSAKEKPVKGSTSGLTPEKVLTPWNMTYANQKCDARKISHHDLVFWLGDMNSRIDAEVPTRQVFSMAKRGEYSKLQNFDQLLNSMEKGKAFDGYSEGALNFPPTYKYIVGTNAYKGEHRFESSAEDALVSAKVGERTDGIDGEEDSPAEASVRAPAWCDRILFRVFTPYLGDFPSDVRPGNKSPRDQGLITTRNAYSPSAVTASFLASIELVTEGPDVYKSCEWLSTSDHKPVSANFLCKLRKINKLNEQNSKQFLMERLSEWEASCGVPIELSAMEGEDAEMQCGLWACV